MGSRRRRLVMPAPPAQGLVVASLADGAHGGDRGFADGLAAGGGDPTDVVPRLAGVPGAHVSSVVHEYLYTATRRRMKAPITGHCSRLHSAFRRALTCRCFRRSDSTVRERKRRGSS